MPPAGWRAARGRHEETTERQPCMAPFACIQDGRRTETHHRSMPRRRTKPHIPYVTYIYTPTHARARRPVSKSSRCWHLAAINCRTRTHGHTYSSSRPHTYGEEVHTSAFIKKEVHVRGARRGRRHLHACPLLWRLFACMPLAS